jgi:hypothetical protein
LVICHIREGSSPAGSGPMITPGLGPSKSSAACAAASACQHTSAYVSMRQHASAFVSIRQLSSAYVACAEGGALTALSAHVSICQHKSVFVSMRQHTLFACAKKAARSRSFLPSEPRIQYFSPRNVWVRVRGKKDQATTCQHTSAYVSIREHTRANVSKREHAS